MLLRGKTAVVFAAAGAVGRQTARALAREGAQLFISGRRLAPVEALAADILRSGGQAEAAAVDACEEKAITAYVDGVAARAGAIDIHVNAIGIPAGEYGQGVELVDLPVDRYMLALQTFLRSQYLTTQAVGRVMRGQGSGVIVTLSTSAGAVHTGLVGGLAAASAAVDALMRTLASELGPAGVRVVGVRPGAMPETPMIKDVYQIQAAARGLTGAQLDQFVASRTVAHRQPTVDETAETITFLASDRASGLTATVVNVSLGEVVG
jgi:NAD(P)-dependent dehydrogenase (short-subunit alcohol dehydrogenase family)